MSELELKLALPSDQLEPLAAHPALLRRCTGPMVVQTMRARYYDTADRQLGALRMSLRLRQEGAGWVQTVKTAPALTLALSQRGEWEHALAGPRLDWAALAATPLCRVEGFDTLARRLREVFEMRFERHLWPLAWPDGTRAVLSLDLGDITTGRGPRRRSVPVSEVEIEHLGGDASHLWKLAQRLARDLPLVPLAVSKAERGWALRDATPPQPVRSRRINVDAAAPVVDALAAAVAAPLAGLQHNLRHLTPAQPEFVHQARVALRRLRGALRAVGSLHEGRAVRDALRLLSPPLRDLGHVLGTARDADVFISESLPALATAAQVPDSVLFPLARRAARWRAAAYAALDAHLQQPAHGAALLRAERLVWALSGQHGMPDTRPAHEAAATLARVAYRRVVKAARRLAREGPEARHALRIEVKRLRYLLDQWQDVWPASRTQASLLALQGLQDLLGPLNDAAVADRLLTQLRAPARLRAAWQVHLEARLARDMPLLADRLAGLLATPVPWRRARPEG